MEPALDVTVTNGFYVTGRMNSIEALNEQNVLDVRVVETTVRTLFGDADTIEIISTYDDAPGTSRAIQNFNANGWLLFESYTDGGEVSQRFTYDYNENGLLHSLSATNPAFSLSDSSQVYAYNANGLESVSFYEADILSWVETFIYNTDGVVVGSNLVRESTTRLDRECEISYIDGLRSRVECYDYEPGGGNRLLQSITEMEYDDNGNLIKDTRSDFKVELFPEEDALTAVPIGTLMDRSTIVFEYAQTDRDVPNDTLFGDFYFPTR